LKNVVAKVLKPPTADPRRAETAAMIEESMNAGESAVW
jgi:hypothetical protein